MKSKKGKIIICTLIKVNFFEFLVSKFLRFKWKSVSDNFPCFFVRHHIIEVNFADVHSFLNKKLIELIDFFVLFCLRFGDFWGRLRRAGAVLSYCALFMKGRHEAIDHHGRLYQLLLNNRWKAICIITIVLWTAWACVI